MSKYSVKDVLNIINSRVHIIEDYLKSFGKDFIAFSKTRMEYDALKELSNNIDTSNCEGNNTMKIDHELKILPCYFEQVVNGNKTFEIRDNSDRGFQKGDIVKLREYAKQGFGMSYTGKEIIIKITYVTNAYQQDDYVVFAFEKLEEYGDKR